MVWLFLRSPRPGGPHASVQSHLSHQAQGLKLQAVHKVAFHIGNFTVAWYGVLVAMAFLIGLWLAGRRGIRDGIPPEKIMDVGPWMILGTIIGARTLYVITYWKEAFAGNPFYEIFMVQHGGLVFYGGFIGASIAVIIYLHLKKLPLWKFGDAIAPSVALGYVLGRFGCLMNGCCYGKPTDVPWAIRFPADHDTHGVPVHPTQIYDAILSFIFYLVLAWLYRRKKFDGQIFATYLMGYAAMRSFVETYRGDYTAEHIHGLLTPAQLVSLGIFSAGLLLYFVLQRRPAQPQPA
jgi:phosphatidylglycerol:prolipoprotein diacylglycerol transferase